MISRHTLKSTFNSASIIMFGLAILTTTGCLGGLGLTNGTLPTEPISSDSAGVYRVELSGHFSKSSTYQGEIDGPITVQDALERSGATKKFKSMDILVYRVVKESGRGLKMPVEYMTRTKSVTPQTDYAIHPNDRVVVQARTLTAIDKIANSLNPYK